MLAQSHSLEAVGRYQGPSGVLSRPLCPSRITHQGWECLELLLRFRIRVCIARPQLQPQKLKGETWLEVELRSSGRRHPLTPSFYRAPQQGVFSFCQFSTWLGHSQAGVLEASEQEQGTGPG